jgi:DNA-binding MarR family transcriptional regulator
MAPSPYCNCLVFSANALSRIITKIADEAFASTGLPSSYAFLVMQANKNPGATIGALGEALQLTPSTLTRLVEKMEQKGYLRRETAGRTTLVFPTEAATLLDPALRLAWASIYHQYVDVLGEKTAQQLTADVYAASSALRKTVLD